jgi:hypothetical protein
MSCEEASLKKNTFSAPAGFAALGFWQKNSSALLVGGFIVLAVAVVLWLILRRRHDAFPEIMLAPRRSELEKGITMVEESENLPEKPVRPATFPGIYGKISVLVNGQQAGSFLVTDNQLTIGRDPAQALALIQEPIVSKLHCSIQYRDGQIVIKDHHSTNGTFVNDERIDEHELQDNDVVSLGKKGTVKIIYRK